MATHSQVQKLAELHAQGYYQDEETNKVYLAESNFPGGSAFLKSPTDHTIVEVNIAGDVKPYKSASGKSASAQFAAAATAQFAKVRELTAQGYFGDHDTQEITLKEANAINGSIFLKTPHSHKIVEVDAKGNTSLYNPLEATFKSGIKFVKQGAEWIKKHTM